MSSAYISSFLVFILALTFVTDFGLSEKLKLKASLTNRGDGYKVASLFIGNATGKTMKNLSIELDLDTIIDGSNRLRGAQGFIREIRTDNNVELACFDSSKEEDIKRALFLCPEKGDQILRVVSRSEWGSQEHVARRKRLEAADLLIVDGIGYNDNSDDYFATMRTLENHQIEHFGDLWCNIWISDDGTIFEGLGMDYFNDIYNGGLGPRSLIIAFLKKENQTQPSSAAISSFRKLVKNAVCEKKLSLHYRLVPYYLIFDHLSSGNDSFERKEMVKWESYTNSLDFLFPSEGEENWVSQIVPRRDWSSETQIEELSAFSSQIKHIILMSYGARCFYNCTDYLKRLEHFLKKSNQSLSFNFLLAEDGKIYEITGWEKTWHKYMQQNKAIQVGFLGYFNSYVPRKPIFLALNSLIQHGLSSGKLSPHYKVVTIKSFIADSKYMGLALEEVIKKLDNYSNKI